MRRTEIIRQIMEHIQIKTRNIVMNIFFMFFQSPNNQICSKKYMKIQQLYKFCDHLTLN